MAITPVQGKQIATASWANNAVSSSYAVTASYLSGYVSPFPYTGSATITGSLVVTGSVTATQGVTGSLFGTSSWAISSSRAVSSSFASTATNASYAGLVLTQNSNTNQDYSIMFAPSGTNGYIQTYTDTTSDILYNPSTNKLTVPIISASSGITGSLFGTASWAVSSSRAVTSSFAISASQAQNAVSASNATTASYATTAATASTISAAITNNVNNYVLTATGTGVINGESRLTFDGNTLTAISKVQQGDISNLADGGYSHAEGIQTATLLEYSHAEGTGSFTGQYGYLADSIRDTYTLQISRDVANQFSGGYIIYDDTKYANIYGVLVLPYSSVSFSTATDIVINQDLSSGFTGALIGIPGVSTPVDYTHVLPSYTIASHAEGQNTIADGNASHAEGITSTSVGDYSHAEGSGSLTVAQYSHAEGKATKTFGSGSHAEGINTIAVNYSSHTEGNQTYTGQYAYECTVNDKSEIYTNTRYGDVSGQFVGTYLVFDDTTTGNINGLIEVKVSSVSWTGTQVKIISDTSIAQSSKGYVGIGGVFAPTKADTFIPLRKGSSHAEGQGTFALGEGSHTEGYGTRTTGDYSSARGIGTIAQGHYQTIIGKYNIPSSDTGYIFIVGNGTSDSARSNALTIRNSAVAIPGTLQVQGGITGDLSGTASYATQALSASYAATASVLLGSVVSASYATTASYALNGGSGTTFPYSGSAIITGSLTVSSSLTVTGSLRVSGSITGSLFGTSSWAVSAISSSYPIAASGSSVYTVTPSATSVGRNNTILLGPGAGSGGTSIYSSNFLGYGAGNGALNAYQSNFVGVYAGAEAAKADDANFIGMFAGYKAVSASFSNLIGWQAGYTSDATTSIGSNNIIIGTNITLASQQKDSINLGGIIFATGSYSNIASLPSSGSQYGIGRVGINKVLPEYTLDVSGSGNYSNGLTVTGSLVATSFTGSLFGTSSWAVSSSNSTTASYVLQAVSSSYALSSSFAATSSYSTNFTVSGSINNVDYIDFNPTKYDTVTPGTIPTQKEGRLFYDTGSQTLCMYNAEADVTLNIGQESWLRARNQTGATITNGSVVKISGAIGNRPSISLAQARDQVQTFNADNDIIGMATHDIETGTDGFVTTFGLVNGVNTAGFTAGDLLWVSSSAGQYTNIAPSAPIDKTFVGVVTRANANNGTIFVTPNQPLHFHDISSVSASGYTQGDVWMFNQSGSSGVWTNTKTLSGSYSISGNLTVTGSMIGTSSWATNAQTASYVLNAVSSSFAQTSSYINTLNQNVLITGSMTIGSSSLGASENTLTLGARDTGGEGGQLGFHASGGTYTSASMLDNYQNRFRLLRGTNAGSDAEVAWWSMHTKQMALPAYNSATAFSGTPIASLGVDSGGNILTTGYYNYKNTTASSAVTGSTAETQVLQVTIPANTFASSDFFRIYLQMVKTGTSAASSVNIKMSTSSTMPAGNASRIALFTLPAGSLFGGVSRTFTVKGGNIEGFPKDVSSADGLANSTTTLASNTFNPAVTQYLYISMTNGDTLVSTILNSIQISNT